MIERFAACIATASGDPIAWSNAVIECATWSDWRTSFLVGLTRAVMAALIVVAVVGTAMVARQRTGHA